MEADFENDSRGLRKVEAKLSQTVEFVLPARRGMKARMVRLRAAMDGEGKVNLLLLP
jgi:hypothetical protein